MWYKDHESYNDAVLSSDEDNSSQPEVLRHEYIAIDRWSGASVDYLSDGRVFIRIDDPSCSDYLATHDSEEVCKAIKRMVAENIPPLRLRVRD